MPYKNNSKIKYLFSIYHDIIKVPCNEKTGDFVLLCLTRQEEESQAQQPMKITDFFQSRY